MRKSKEIKNEIKMG